MISKKILFYISYFFILYLLLTIFTDPYAYYPTIIDTLSLWLYKVVPPLFLMYFITIIIISFELSYYVSIILYPLRKLLRFETNEGFVLYLLSHFLSNPGLIIIAKERYEENKITQKDYETLICCGSNVSFLFIFSLAIEKEIALVIYLSMVIANLFICIYKNRKNKVTPIKISNPSPKSIITLSKSFDKISNFSYIILRIAIYMLITSILVTSFKSTILNNFTFLLDLAYGSLKIISTNANLVFLVILLSFQGISMHLQVMPIIKKNYPKYLLSRIVATIIALIIYSFFA